MGELERKRGITILDKNTAIRCGRLCHITQQMLFQCMAMVGPRGLSLARLHHPGREHSHQERLLLCVSTTYAVPVHCNRELYTE
jgi:hypothetical protein